DAVQGRMTAETLDLGVLLLVLVTAETVAHRRRRRRGGEGLGELRVAGRAVLLDSLDVLGVVHDHRAGRGDGLRRVRDVGVAVAAVALVLLLAVALEAGVLGRQRLGGGAELGLVEDALVTGDALHLRLGVHRVRHADLVARRVDRRRALQRLRAAGEERDEHHGPPHGDTFFAR